jgi:hypothetical protein
MKIVKKPRGISPSPSSYLSKSTTSNESALSSIMKRLLEAQQLFEFSTNKPETAAA